MSTQQRFIHRHLAEIAFRKATGLYLRWQWQSPYHPHGFLICNHE